MTEMNAQPDAEKRPRRYLIWVGGILLIVFLWFGINALKSTEEPTVDTVVTPTGDLQVNVQDGDVFNDPILALTGSGPPDQLIFINGQPVPVLENGLFELTLQLAEGPNLILVEARDADGRVTSLARQVIYTLPGEEPLQIDDSPPSPQTFTNLMALSLGVIILAVFIVFLRRRRPWINLTTDREQLVRGPADEGITIILELDRTTRLSLFIHDDRGARVTTLLNNRRRTGKRHTFIWNGLVSGEPVADGTYVVHAIAGGFTARSTANVEFLVMKR